jgi:hypothetical protein
MFRSLKDRLRAKNRQNAPPPYTGRVSSVQDQKPSHLFAEYPSSSCGGSAASNSGTSCTTTDAQLSSLGPMTFHETQAHDPYAALRNYDTVFLIDDSSSMWGTKWEQTRDALKEIVPICTSYDKDGVDICFLNYGEELNGVRSAKEVMAIFDKVKPLGTTPTGQKLGGLLRKYINRFSSDRSLKPMNIICITDGEPDNPTHLRSEILWCAQRLDWMDAPARQVGVQFFQVGDDRNAEEALEALDNGLAEAHDVRDMIDTVSYTTIKAAGGFTANAVLKAVMGAIDGKLDRKRKIV